MIHTISSYHTKMTEQIKSAKKLYLGDNGFLNLGINRSLNSGAILENETFLILEKICSEVTYIKENYEIDFRCENRLIQVSYKMDDEKTRKRELRVFDSFDKNRSYEHIVVSYDETNIVNNIKIVKFEDFVFEYINT